MSVSRACAPCRAAKTKCDLVRPACGRCTQRRLKCLGFPVDAGFIFCNENGAAQRNSERARKERKGAVTTFSVVVLLPKEEEKNNVQILSLPSPTSPPRKVARVGCRQRYRWLNDRALARIPRSPARDLENEALERFFMNWTLNPSNNGLSPGHMHELPSLYMKAPSGSVLWFAVRAMAFADMRDFPTGDETPFNIKARQGYGAALKHIREMAGDERNLADDQVLAAIILVDSFELMYLAHNNLFGSHIGAVKRILLHQGDKQLYNQTSFALWRIAHQRLQFRQILLREEPDHDQIAWVGQLNHEMPDLRMSADIMRMNILSAAAKKLIEGQECTNATHQELIQHAKQLAGAMQDLIATMDIWTSNISETWKPQTADPHDIAQQPVKAGFSGFPIPKFPCPHLLSYHDIWLAYMWNFHAASQIVLRESLIEVITYRCTILEKQEPDLDDMKYISNAQFKVDRLSAEIIQSVPWLLGFTRQAREPYTLPQGKMVGRFFSLFSIWVVQRARFNSAEHKQTASDVIDWINSRHGLA